MPPVGWRSDTSQRCPPTTRPGGFPGRIMSSGDSVHGSGELLEGLDGESEQQESLIRQNVFCPGLLLVSSLAWTTLRDSGGL